MQGFAVTGRNTSTSNIMTMTNSDARRFLYIGILMSKNCSSLHTLLKETQGTIQSQQSKEYRKHIPV